MRLRTFTGTRWPAMCACGCGRRIEPSPDAKVVVDVDAHPRKTWLPEHAPATTDGNDAGALTPAPTPPSPPTGPSSQPVDPGAAARPIPASSTSPNSASARRPHFMTVEGQRWPSKCACGCETIIPAGLGVSLVVEMGSRPRRVYFPEHSPEADRARAMGTAAPQRSALPPEAA
ncbi:MAG: hypothetical protein KGJ23_11230 [Euryarchaeota archaeon]|nr:hypothetical protein [Euryarchaeota archaeon]MDE1837166.1 hypothetical protein [Euryarchaeota archaeon]MDE1881496.1 hypothetical protein [Euryarchaeota archaeon]MDE2045322.1 hypothetical protein [Thermoplasmata archaeon]